ncbi:hypothetical protein BLA29_000658 [Euroglyphus maynei]|uniref:Uncharacterized protein n=1 Tax=Euroglyphus maynei TaxID=6958 RepID=A0A1Y3B650_EURMA|nr:hypothetical protein BLA29_000658 [Euroglyphus maynei]
MKIDQTKSTIEVDNVVHDLMESLRNSCENCLPKIKPKSRPSLPNELKNLHKLLNSLRRRFQRQRCQIVRELWYSRYINCVKEYKLRLIEYKNEKCRQFFTDQNKDTVWQQVYKFCKPSTINQNLTTIQDDNGVWTRNVKETADLK